VLGNFAAEEDGFFLFAIGSGPIWLMPHSQTMLRAIIRGAFDVVAGAGGDVAEENLFRACARPSARPACPPDTLV